MSSSLLQAPAFPLCFLVSSQYVLAAPGLTGEPAGSFSSSYALGLIQANGVSQFIMHLPPLPPVRKLHKYQVWGKRHHCRRSCQKKSCQYPMEELRNINICNKMCPDLRRRLEEDPSRQKNEGHLLILPWPAFVGQQPLYS